jgi:hypothetical protein
MVVRRRLVFVFLGLCACGSSNGADDDDDGGGDVDAAGGDASPCGSGADVRGALSELDLSVAGRVYEIDMAAGDVGFAVTAGNGCAITREAGIGFAGEHGVRLIPPDQLVIDGSDPPNSQYCGFASGAPVSRGGVEVGQLNVRYAMFIGREFAAAITPGNGPKAFMPVAVDANGMESRQSRPMTFWGLPWEHDGVTYAGVGVTDATVASYQEPEEDYWPIGGGRDALYFGAAPDHAGSATLGTPVVGDEWVIIEHEIDLRRDRGNPDGLNRLWVWTRDGVLAGPIIDIPLTWHAEHDFSADRVNHLDGIGHYWNRPGLHLPEGHAIYSHVAFAANRPTGDPIGPPPGFLAPCTP